MVQKGGYISKKKGAKKGTKKKIIDSFSKKEWFDLRAPAYFDYKTVGKTLVTRSSAKQNVNKLILNRVFEANQADLQTTLDTFRRFRFIITSVNNREVKSDFYSMEITVDKSRGIIRKWHTLVEGSCLAETTDGYILRFFVMAVSKRQEGNLSARVYIQSAKVKMIRRVMFDTVNNEVCGCDLNSLMKKVCVETIGKKIEADCASIFPIHNCYVKKIMVVKRPKLNVEENEAINE